MPNADLSLFFTAIYGPPTDQERFMCVAFLRPGGKMVERYFRWGDGLDGVHKLIDQALSAGADTYYCVSLLTAQQRSREFIEDTHCVWADLDATPPSHLLLQPTFLIETSMSHYQGIWTLTDAVPYSTAEDFSRRIYHTHRAEGADACWDATRLLRMPGTPNYKYLIDGVNPIVTLISQRNIGFDLDDLDAAYSVQLAEQAIPASIVLDYENVEMVGSAEEILRRYKRELDEDILDLIFTVHDPDDERWSHRQWALEMALFEAGMDIYEVFVIMKIAACNKYERDNRPDADLWKELARARETHERKAGMVLTTEEIELIDLLEDDEIAGVASQEPTFIDRYQAWASSRTDAPREFHIGGALMALSSVLSDRLVVPTQFGEVRPNLWVMLMANSTIARKTTSMRLSQEISGSLVDNVMATDGSIEGLLTELGARKGIPSVFVRDEFTSMVAGAKRKDYMAGLMSDLCGLYDGTRVKRRLRKESIVVDDPIFLFFAGGVETQLLEILDHSDVTSGFIPRFLPIFGHTTVADLDLIGPAKDKVYEVKDALVDELREMTERLDFTQTKIRVAGESTGTVRLPVRVGLSEAAWKRLQRAQRYLLDLADDHTDRDLLLPCTERLVVNVIKVASLIAASRQRELDGSTMQIELDDLMLALYYARGWLDHLLRIVSRIGRDPFDQETQKVLEFVTAAGEGGMNRSAIMRQFRMSNRDADAIIGTLEEREEIVADGGRGPTKRGAIYRATVHARTAKQTRVSAPQRVRRNNPNPAARF